MPIKSPSLELVVGYDAQGVAAGVDFEFLGRGFACRDGVLDEASGLLLAEVPFLLEHLGGEPSRRHRVGLLIDPNFLEARWFYC